MYVFTSCCFNHVNELCSNIGNSWLTFRQLICNYLQVANYGMLLLLGHIDFAIVGNYKFIIPGHSFYPWLQEMHGA